jgi:two-component system LytT family sensor kinase
MFLNSQRTQHSALSTRYFFWALALGGWTLLGLLSASRIKLNYAYTNNSIAWSKALVFALTDWYVWALLSPALFWIARRYPLEPRIWWRSLLIQLPVGIGLSLIKMIIEFNARRWLTPEYARRFPTLELSSTIFTYSAIIGVIYAYDYYRKYRAHELKSSQLSAKLAEAQLQALRMQLNPHFLFNTLHAISSLMRQDVEAADRMIVELSDLLRLTLEKTGAQEVPLRWEIEFLERYLGIEQMRFRDRLEVRWKIEPETLDARVPNLILQPLVENAVRHGIARRAARGVVEICAAREDGHLQIEVRDNGVGLPDNWKEGVGLRNTRARLEHLYGPAHRFTIANATTGGLHVRLTLPLRMADSRETRNDEGDAPENPHFDRR